MEKSNGARFFEKISEPPFLGQMCPKMPKFDFLTFKENVVVSFLNFDWKQLEHIVVELSAKTACPGKIWFSRYGSKRVKRGRGS